MFQDRPAYDEFRACEEIADLFNRSVGLHTHRVGDCVVERNGLPWEGIVVDRDVECPFVRNVELLSEVAASGRKRTT